MLLPLLRCQAVRESCCRCWFLPAFSFGPSGSVKNNAGTVGAIPILLLTACPGPGPGQVPSVSHYATGKSSSETDSFASPSGFIHSLWPCVLPFLLYYDIVHLPAMVRTRRSSSYGRSLKLKDGTGTAKKLSWGDELNLLKSPTGKAGEKQQQQSNKLKQVAAGGVTKKRNSNGNFNTIDAGKTPGKTLESASARKRRMNARRTSRGKTVERKLPEENIFSPPPAPKVSKLKHGTTQKSNAYLTQHPRKQQPPQVAARPVTSPVTPGVPSSASPAAGFFSFLKPFRAWAFGEQR